MSGPSNRTSTGQGATEKLTTYLRTIAGNQTLSVRRMVEWLDNEGFIIVPKPYKAPARRGNSRKPPVYTGPALIGKSHVQRLIG